MFLIISTLVLSMNVFAIDVECLKEKNKKYVQLKTKWIEESKNIFIKAMPEEKKLIELMTKDQLLRLQSRSIAVDILLTNGSGKEWIDTGLPIPNWVTIGAEKRELLAKKHENYFKIYEEAKKISKKFENENKAPLKELNSKSTMLSMENIKSQLKNK